ncbi:MAG: DUF808 domain-containing protein [Chitinophagaceae bacterium]|nr:DUF808 domain-containing protein [Chitinophagaceae bacterium]
MASGLFALLDDIGSLMDDVALATKIATQKTAGILGDDLAVNAEKSVGFVSSRELPALWAISKGSLVNKAIIIPLVFLLNIFFPVAIKVILVIGGGFLAYEGAEKIIEYFFHRHSTKQTAQKKHQELKADDNSEKQKVLSAIRTDFILSLEIVIIALSTVLDKGLWLQIVTVLAVSLVATVGVYGIVALIVRMDDLGYKLIRKTSGKGLGFIIGRLLVVALPVVIKVLSVVGTVALLMVAGGLLLHNIPFMHHLTEFLPEIIASLLIGLVSGTIVFVGVWGIGRLVNIILKRKVTSNSAGQD